MVSPVKHFSYQKSSIEEIMIKATFNSNEYHLYILLLSPKKQSIMDKIHFPFHPMYCTCIKHNLALGPPS